VADRYRCTACGNLTRFDVTTSRRTRAFHHYSVGGHLTVEDVEMLDERVEAVECRWCGPGVRVEVLPGGTSVEAGHDGSAAAGGVPSDRATGPTRYGDGP
jgi:hypothetical protein